MMAAFSCSPSKGRIMMHKIVVMIHKVVAVEEQVYREVR
jgi:hypothetical protein